MEDGMSDGQETESEAQTLDPIQEYQRLADVGRASLNCPGWICRVFPQGYSVLRDAAGGLGRRAKGLKVRSRPPLTLWGCPQPFHPHSHPPCILL